MNCRAVVAAGLIVAGIVLGATEVEAQIHHLDEFPWYTVSDSLARRGAAMRYDQFRDSDTSWRTDRLSVVLHTAVGRYGVFFFQADFLRFDTADLSVLERWPHLAQEDEDGNAETDGPYESMIGGFGRPELGVLAPLPLPLLG